MKRIVSGIVASLLVVTWVHAESSVWKVQKGNSVMYLGGTCHLLRTSDFPLPAEFDKAYQASDLLVFETDIGKINDLSTQQKLMTAGQYTDGTTVEDHLSAQAYLQLSGYCASNGIPLVALRQFKPPMIVIMLTTMELVKMGVTQDGVDTSLYRSAAEDKKPTEALETVDEQIEFVTTMGEGNEDAFIAHSIRDMQDTKQDYERLVDAWRAGDVETLDKLMIDEFKAEVPKIYKELLTDRNRNWQPAIDRYVKTPEKEFILVGIGHLVGPDGIIESLKKKGCKVEKV